MKTVLVVDDDSAMGQMVRGIVEWFGFDTILCKYGVEAIRHIGKADILVTDYNMPPGMNGAQLTEIAKRQKPNMPVLIITGTLDDVPSNHLADMVIEKPVGIKELKEWLETV